MDSLNDDHDHEEPLVRYHNEVNRTILYVSMVSFMTVLFLVFALYLYARCVLRGRTRHRAAIRRLTIAALHVSDLDATTHRHAEPPNTGLEPAIIASLPTFNVKAKAKDGSGGSDGGDTISAVECAVCLSSLDSGEKAKLLPNCNHFFHVDCIDTWLGSHSTCPLCRAGVKPRLAPQDREGPMSLSLNGASALLNASIENSCKDNNKDNGESSKINDSNSSSRFRRILTRERSSRRIQPSGHDDEDGGVDQDLERQ